MNRPMRPAGFVLHETLMALTLALALVVGVAQLLTMAVEQRRLARQYVAAMHEAGNVMENVISRRWAETTAARLGSVSLSETCCRCLPAAKLAVDVVDESDDVRRISVRIDWRSASGSGGEPVRLVGWKTRVEEDGP